jgi:hypothetical protein
MSDAESNKAVVSRFMDEVSDGGNVDLLDDLCTADVINHAARRGLQHGLESFKVLMRSIHEAQDDRHWTEQRYVAEHDLVVVYGVREGYWHAAKFRGVATPEPGHIATELAPHVPARRWPDCRALGGA